jgi:cell wall assembly regulator SMI1
MEEIWKRIDSWLEANAPVVFQSLQPGASDSQIQAVEDALSIQFPEDVRASYRIHNGQSTVDYGAHGLIPLAREFLCLERLQHKWQVNEEVFGGGDFPDLDGDSDPGIRADWWNRRWIPLTSDGAGDSECLDLDPADGGAVGQIITMMTHDNRREMVASSFRSWLEEYATKLESGEYVFSEESDGIVTLEFLEYCKKLKAEQERKNIPAAPETVITARSVTIGIYDGWKKSISRDAPPEDKDEVTIALNGESIFQNILLDSTKQFYNIELAPRVNTITVTLLRAALEGLSMPVVTIDESLIDSGASEHRFALNEMQIFSFTISYLSDD